MQTILLVEDNEDDVFFMKQAKEKAGIKNPMQVAEDGQQALDYLQGTAQYADRERYPLPFLILLDLKLPFVLGLDVLKWIRKRPDLETVLVVVLTSSQENCDVDQAYRLGANSYLVKPPNAQKLLEMVRALKEYWVSLNQAPVYLGTVPPGLSAT